MAIFEVATNELKALAETNFNAEKIMERRDIQRLLREQISVIDDSLMVIAEEFGDWLDSARRIDLLCIDLEANLVVVELKRTEDGGHMELQALRYAAMISTMTFDQLVETFARYKSKVQPDIDEARQSILSFLGWADVIEEQFAQDSRIVLASADFGKELTTAVMWLIERGIDIRCVRLKPYKMMSGQILLDVQQLIPLPEAADFQTQLGVKKQAERQNRSERHDLRLKFWEGLLDRAKGIVDVHANRKPTKDSWLSGGVGRAGFSLLYAIRRSDSRVELWISHGKGQTTKNKAAFKALETCKAEIEDDFGDSLDWHSLPDSDTCRICYVLENGGYHSPAADWPDIQVNLAKAMARLEKAFRGRIAKLQY